MRRPWPLAQAGKGRADVQNADHDVESNVGDGGRSEHEDLPASGAVTLLGLRLGPIRHRRPENFLREVSDRPVLAPWVSRPTNPHGGRRMSADHLHRFIVRLTDHDLPGWRDWYGGQVLVAKGLLQRSSQKRGNRRYGPQDALDVVHDAFVRVREAMEEEA